MYTKKLEEKSFPQILKTEEKVFPLILQIILAFFREIRGKIFSSDFKI